MELFEESLECNEYIASNIITYYGDSNKANYYDDVEETKSCGLEVSSSQSISKMSATGGGFYSVGAALIIVGAAVVAVERTKGSNKIGKDLDNALVSKGGDVA